MLRSSDLQYGFKAKHSTSHCNFVLHDVIDYYTNNDSSVFLVLLDASRALESNGLNYVDYLSNVVYVH